MIDKLETTTNNILIHRFVAGAELHHSRPAIDFNGQLYIYRELLEQSAKIANAILDCNPESQAPVGILASKSYTAYSGILGALMASKAYMPLNHRFPVHRNAWQLEKSGCNTIIAGREGLEHLKALIKTSRQMLFIILPDISPEEQLQFEQDKHTVFFAGDLDNTSLPLIKSQPEQMAYLLFTSGTTGQPKGVPVNNENITSYLDYILKRFDLNEKDRFSQTFDLTFDLSMHDLFVSWLSGGCLCIPSADATFAMSKYIRDQRLTVWFSVPSVAVMMSKMHLLRAGNFENLKYSFFCGEPLLEKTASAWQKAAPDSAVINLYGPTETTIAISAYEWKQDIKENKVKNGIVSIGKIFETQDYCIADDQDRILGTEKKGFLHLSGSQVISGYFRDEENTKKYFKSLNKNNNDWWYNTGDLVTGDNEHDLFFLGRQDNEVKISGYRVNLLEIDEIIRKATRSEMVATVDCEHDGGETKTLVSFIEKTEDVLSEEKIMEFCRKHLPWYMLPGKIIFMESLPLNENGKIDRKRLSEML